MSLVAFGDHVIVRVPPREVETKTTGGIVIPSTVSTDADKTGRALVVAAGPGTQEAPMAVLVGDTVLFQPHHGVEIKHDGETLLALRQAQIIARVQ